MRRLILAAALFAATAVFAADDPYAALRLYNGSWIVKGEKPDHLVDRCALVGTYFVCEQAVNGKTGALLVFVPTGTPGHFATQNIFPDGRASGRGELTIDGNRWTFSSNAETKHYRTINVFTGTDQIHSESAQSDDGEHWTVTHTGDLVRDKSAS